MNGIESLLLIILGLISALTSLLMGSHNLHNLAWLLDIYGVIAFTVGNIMFFIWLF